MSARNPQFRLAISITRPEPGLPWNGYTGRLNEAMLCAIAPDFYQRTIYVCGPDSFMKGTRAMLEGMGFPMQNYYEESFGGKKTRPSKAPTAEAKSPVSSPVSSPVLSPVLAPVTPSNVLQTVATTASRSSTAIASTIASPVTGCVVFAKSGKTAQPEAETSILELAEQEGVALDSSCRSGACGTCKVKKLEGAVQYSAEPDALDPTEQDEGYILACIAHPVGTVTVDV